MIICKKISDLQRLIAYENQGKGIGFVPTMGALHQGHIALINACKKNGRLTVASIFVNPTQFNDARDFEKYPITIDNDVRMLEGAGCNYLFLPSVTEMYPHGTVANMHYDLGELENLLEGFYRPGHYQGVCQVVHRLLAIVKPRHLYMGQKDYQQCMVVQRMMEQLGMDINMHVVPTLREVSGLAMSSRNMRLTEGEKEQAAIIYKELHYIKEQMGKQSLALLKEKATASLLAHGFSKVDYIDIADAATLHPLATWEVGQKAVVLVAAFLNEVRLIDNIVMSRSSC